MADASLLKKITLDGAELDICDDTARATGTANTNKIAELTDTVNSIKVQSGVNITYDSSNSALVITHN